MLIQFPYNAEAVEAIKELPARKWNPAERGWEIPDFLASAAAVKLEPFYPDIADALRSHVASVTVEGFGTERIMAITKTEIEDRFRQLVGGPGRI